MFVHGLTSSLCRRWFLPHRPRGGRRHALQLDNDTRRRCLDWVSTGSGATFLWTPDHGRRGQSRKGPNVDSSSDALPRLYRCSRFHPDPGGCPPTGLRRSSPGPSRQSYGRGGLFIACPSPFTSCGRAVENVQVHSSTGPPSQFHHVPSKDKNS